MDERELDRLQELANIGAGHAATAFANLTGRTIWMEVPRVCRLDTVPSPAFPAGDGAWSTGVFFEFEGYVADMPLEFALNANVTSAVSIQRSGPRIPHWKT